MSEPGTAYLYRRVPIETGELRALLRDYVFGAAPVYAFAANTVELQAIYSCASADDVRLAGDTGDFDFGRVFSRQAELRWKRSDTTFDALLLTEQAIPELAEAEIRSERRLTIRIPPPQVVILLEGAHRQQKLSYIEYLAENGALQFQRYRALQ